MTVARLAARVAVHVPESMRHLYTCHIATFTIALLDKDRTGREKNVASKKWAHWLLWLSHVFSV